jgi:hypothetical protein
MLQLQEAENWNRPAATTWAAEFLLQEGEMPRINSNAVNEAQKRRAKQVITCSFPCGKWLYRFGVRTSPGCELCKRERRKDMVSLAFGLWTLECLFRGNVGIHRAPKAIQVS